MKIKWGVPGIYSVQFLMALGLFMAPNAQAQRAPEIFGGVEVAANDPISDSTVRIKGYIDRASFTCSGVLVAPRVVLTAGHCLGPGWAKTEIYLPDGTGPFPGIQQVRHEKYQTNENSNLPWYDLALIQMAQPLPSPFRPVPWYQTPQQLKAGQNLVLAGYGQNVTDPNPPGDGGIGILRKVQQSVETPHFNDLEFTMNIFQRGACFGDSGGPAYQQTSQGLVLVGITSRLTDKDIVSSSDHQKAYACLHDIIYTDVSMFSNWLQANLKLLQ